MPGFGAGSGLPFDGEGGSFSPGGDTEVEGKLHGMRGRDADADVAAEGVGGLLRERDWRSLDGGVDLAGGVDGGGEAAEGGLHPETGGEFGPALMEVGGAAAEVRGEAEDVGLGAVGGPGLAVQADFDLVGLLVVLVGPHAVGEGPGEGVEGDLFEAITEGGIAKDGE